MFSIRYDFPEVELDRSTIAEPFSAAEDELLEFLAMASDSYPMHKVICVEAFELENKHEASTAYSPSLFGCASPSSFVTDVIVVMNLRYLIRQNCYSVYSVMENAGKGSLVLTSHTKSNFSSYGQLYALLLIIDVLLLTLNCLSSLELIQWMTFPKFQDVKSWAEQIEAK
ncbi:hypothetical protein Poli38472_005755 [Pythium oligandrum]|uniref:Uncharacterized protein n=1 Tax=Pythium oligandrum TaxID=41045 RepID=A0A8K1CR53_PYTOL|nr:hypothetical protein Poli38472_005755 [Pythium oligandrum]|eukprot:TMW68287.1 hypothetical protein Poli38472_005755 [Pythium oligandrum]